VSRVVIIVAAVLVFFWLLRRALASRKQDGQPPAQKRPQNESGSTPDLVSCAHCGVHLPKGEAVEAGEGRDAGRFFCSDEHRRLGSR
jgi:uncharacterized protein